MEYLCCTLIGYFIGAVNPSYFIAKSKGVDIKKHGSGNAGASNVLILFGKVKGVICALIDIFKAYFAVLLTKYLFPEFFLATALTGSACILGHMFPFYMKFRGGKGLACLGGTILAFGWRVFVGLLSAELILVLIVDYICFVPMTASVVFAVTYGLMTGDVAGSLILMCVAFIIIVKHFENIKRIRNGTEAHFSYLWKKEEKERIQKNIAKQ